ncbi:hypothetical protein DENSPDRAFT_440656 [Dentipellis sp. KUC8613]|nr:hypothetical protein DENSPDRAFT_440656 [Dentipellis sp. KUC8613]
MVSSLSQVNRRATAMQCSGQPPDVGITMLQSCLYLTVGTLELIIRVITVLPTQPTNSALNLLPSRLDSTRQAQSRIYIAHPSALTSPTTEQHHAYAVVRSSPPRLSARLLSRSDFALRKCPITIFLRRFTEGRGVPCPMGHVGSTMNMCAPTGDFDPACRYLNYPPPW